MGPPRLLAGFLCLTLACTASSCAKHNKDELAVFPVSGKVLFAGKPTPGAIAILHPVGDPDQKRPNPRAVVDREGNFKLSTYRTNDGAPAGDYVVTVDWRKRGADSGTKPRACCPRSTVRPPNLRCT